MHGSRYDIREFIRLNYLVNENCGKMLYRLCVKHYSLSIKPLCSSESIIIARRLQPTIYFLCNTTIETI